MVNEYENIQAMYIQTFSLVGDEYEDTFETLRLTRGKREGVDRCISSRGSRRITCRCCGVSRRAYLQRCTTRQTTSPQTSTPPPEVTDINPEAGVDETPLDIAVLTAIQHKMKYGSATAKSYQSSQGD